MRPEDGLLAKNEPMTREQRRIKGMEDELAQWRTWGIVEIAIRNPNVKSYVEHWEGRALKAEAALAQRAEGAAPKDDVPLRCEVVNGAIEFTIGAKILAHATNISPNLYDAENDRGQYRVTDPAAFAKDVARELDRESEDGSTPLTRLLDTVIEEAINQGAEGVEEVSGAGPAPHRDTMAENIAAQIEAGAPGDSQSNR